MRKIVFVAFLLSSFRFVCGQSISRGPFLQMGNHDAMTVKWSTVEPGIGRLTYGESFQNQSKSLATSSASLLHEFRITNLKPKTKYYYTIYNNEVKLQGDTSNYFITSPQPGAFNETIRMVAFGDCGTQQPAQVEVAKRISEYFGGKPIDGWLLLGDNAYNYGFDSEYQTKFFDVYQKFFLKNTVLWPSPGNHDYGDRVWPNAIGEKPDYYKIFTLPTKGESGGVASGNPAYYSYDYGNVHFVSLDSYGTEDTRKMADTLSKQVLWLKKDLAANKLPWTVVYFHHPPFTKGSHDSDTELDLVAIRENLVKVLDHYKVDVVLNGHSHNYERSYMLHDYRSDELSFNINKHATSSSTGRYDGTPNSCPYIKAGAGTVYVVAGASGWVGGLKPGYPHNAMVTSNSEQTGALVLEVTDNKFVSKYITEKGELFDQFTIYKDVNKKSVKTIECGELVSFGTSWKGDIKSTIGKVENRTLNIDSLNKTIQFTITDKLNCFRDTIQVVVKPYNSPKASSNSPVLEGTQLNLQGKLEGPGKLSWRGPAGFTANTPSLTLDPVKLTDAGRYYLMANYKSCTSMDSVQVEILKILANEPVQDDILNTFPNPTEGLFTVELVLDKAGNFESFLVDGAGRIMKEFSNQSFKEGRNVVEIDLRAYDSGTYLFLLKNGDKILSKKIIKK